MLNILVQGSEDSHGDTEVVGFNALQFTDNERQQIGRHDRRSIELDSLPLATGNLRVHLRLRRNVHVTQTSHLLIRNQRNRKLRLERRLIETRERSARIGRLHLRRSDITGTAVGGLVRRAIETGHVIVQNTGEGLLQLGLGASGDSLGEADGGDLLVLVVGEGGGGGDDSAIDEDVAGVDFEFVGVEGDGGGVFIDVETTQLA